MHGNKENCPNSFCPTKLLCTIDPMGWKSCGLRREYISTLKFNQTRNHNHSDRYYDSLKK